MFDKVLTSKIYKELIKLNTNPPPKKKLPNPNNLIKKWAKEAKEKNKETGVHQIKKFLHRKGNHQQNEKTTH